MVVEAQAAAELGLFYLLLLLQVYPINRSYSDGFEC